MRLLTVSSCSGQSLVSPGVDQPRPRPPVEADIGVDSEGGTVGRQVWCRLTPRLVQLWTHQGGASPEMARVQEEAAVAAGSVKTIHDTYTRPGTGDLMVYYH